MGFYAGKTVLVTGATGLIGSNLVFELLNNKKAKVIAAVRNIEKAEFIYKDYLSNSNLRLVCLDLTKEIDIKDNIDIIFHTAGPIAGKIIKNNPMDVIIPNIEGLKNCLELLKRQKETVGYAGRLVVFSSATVYANKSDCDIKVSEENTNIADNIDAVNAPYSETKRMCEVFARAYGFQYGVDVVIARFAYVYGYTAVKPDTAFYEFVGEAISGNNIVFNNSGFSRRDNIYIDDAVSGVLVLGEKGKSGEAYNVSSCDDLGNFSAIDEIAEHIKNSINKLDADKNIEVIMPDNKNNKRNIGIMLDNSKLKKLGWEPKVSLSVGVNDTVSRYLTT